MIIRKFVDDPVLANYREYGLSGVIPKPFNQQNLSRVLDEILSNKDK